MKLLDNNCATLVKHHRKTYGPIPTPASQGWGGSLNFHSYQAETRYPNSFPNDVVLVESQDFQHCLAVKRLPYPPPPAPLVSLDAL